MLAVILNNVSIVLFETVVKETLIIIVVNVPTPILRNICTKLCFLHEKHES